MSEEDRLAELPLRWEELYERGEDVGVDALCRDCPHLVPALARRIRALKITSWLSKDDDDDPSDTAPMRPDGGPARLLADRYRLDGKIGEGGFAEVWKGYDLELRRTVAVKMPRVCRLDRDDTFERVFAEARRVARLKHPGVVQVFDMGRDGDCCFLVSEFVERGCLADRIAENCPTPQEAVRLVAEVAETLAYAHRQGIVHRDIKPGNILIGHHGRALLADFGIARAPEDGSESGAIAFGTLAYMSPEQVQCQPLDCRTDIYSLGVVLYELLARRLPYRGPDSVAVRHSIVSGLAPPLAGVSKELVNICRKCLQRNPTDRYQDAATLATDLKRLVRSTPSSRRRLVALASGLLLVLLLAAVLPLRQQRRMIERPDSPTIADREEKERQTNPAALEAVLALGKLYFNKKEWDRAETAFSEAIRLDPECAEAFHRRAGSVFNAGRAKASLTDFDSAARLDAKNPEIYKNRGIAYLNLARFEEALADMRQARELDPDHSERYDKSLALIYAQRGVANVQAQKWAEALADLDDAIRFDAGNAEIYDKRGSLHFNERRFDAARKDFSSAIDMNLRQPAYHLHRGYANQALGSFQEAAEDFKQANACSPPIPGR